MHLCTAADVQCAFNSTTETARVRYGTLRKFRRKLPAHKSVSELRTDKPDNSPQFDCDRSLINCEKECENDKTSLQCHEPVEDKTCLQRKRKADIQLHIVSCDHQYVSLDCEFVGVGLRKLSALGRCSIVDYAGRVIVDIYAIPDEPITDYRTRWSGIRRHHMVNAIPFESARNIIKAVIKDKILVGHALHNDLTVLQMGHHVSPEMVRDTSKYEPLKQLAGMMDRSLVSLKTLTFAILGKKIQQKEHDSVEDARAAMELYKYVQSQWEAEFFSSDGALPQRKRQRCTSESTSYLADSFWPEDLH